MRTRNDLSGVWLIISGAHVVIYSGDAEADRAFLRDVLGLPHVDAGHGWLIFALPPSEVAVHPDEGGRREQLFFMCDDLDASIARLADKGISCGEIVTQPWGKVTTITLPSGGPLGLYEPHHPRPA